MLEPIMNTTSRSIVELYAMPSHDMLVFSDALLRAWPLFLRDYDDAAKQEIQHYIDKGLTIFESRIRLLHSKAEPLTDLTEKELRFMLEALLEAKRMVDQA